ncbi:MAG: hypothetical protein JWP81_577 [Ferruginibacter sp.]|nr:hypothetical protein [Ferruginibacter sp.]
MNLTVARIIFFILFIGSLPSCKNASSNQLFKKLDPNETGIQFSNKLVYNDSLTVLEFEYMFNGAGVALIDINNDSLPDVILAGNMVPCKLYLNKGNLRFEDITDKAGIKTSGWSYGVSVVDINQDGFKDFYICKAGNRKTPASEMRNVFFINNGNNTFTESAAAMGLDAGGYNIHAAFFDYDKDGDLDMYLLRNAFVDYNRNNSRPKELTGKAASTDKLFRNNGNGTFTDVSAEAGITIEGFGLGLNICDINCDNWPDIYVSNDFLTNDLVWINNHDGTFTNKASSYLHHETYNAMGNDVADFNNDGLPDVVVVDMLPPDNKRWKLTMMGNNYDEFQQNMANNYEPQYVRNTLQLNNGNGSFSEIGRLSGVSATEWSWAPLFADFDNDGWKDLFISNGYRQDVTNLDFIMYGKRALFMGTAEANRQERLKELNKLPGVQVHNYLYKNNRDLTFSDVSEKWGMTEAAYSNGTAYGDLDNDGDLDLVINNIDEPASVYENQSTKIHPENKWLRIAFDGPAGNRDGLGAKVWIWQNGLMQYNYFSPYRGYLSTVESYLHFGLQNNKVDSLKVLWPDGLEQVIKNIPAGQKLLLKYKDALAQKNSAVIPAPSPLFTSIGADRGINYKHEEDNFVDFKLQPLLAHMHSCDGPAIAVSDVNNDGLDDFFVGAGAGGKPAIFMQDKKGNFSKQQLADSNRADNMGALFFDADNDGDMDLYVAAGGSANFKKDNINYQHFLYLNDGKGKFTMLKDGMPAVVTPASGVIGADYDRDGDIDLFVCGRVSPGEYPLSPKSFLMRNDSKNKHCVFTDVTKSTGTSFSQLGMVSSALWTDFDNDGWPDLVMVGEFMPVRFFKNDKGKFIEVTAQTGLANTTGWWNSITAGDFDKDGDMDYILGNLGLNGPYKASAKYPVCIYASDYDKNGRLDPVMCHYLDGKEYMVHARDDINRQMTPMRGRFRTYEEYANVTFRQAFREDEIAEAYIVKAERFENSYLENKGNGKFVLHSLPLEAQFAPLYGVLCTDFNGDGNLDVIGVGNSFSPEVQTGRYDARAMLLMPGDGKGNFSVVASKLNDCHDNKSIAPIYAADGSLSMLIGANSDSLKMYRINNQQTKSIAINPGDAYALITGSNGRTWRQEFYYGSSYLSQGSRTFTPGTATKSVVIYNYSGTKRIAEF